MLLKSINVQINANIKAVFIVRVRVLSHKTDVNWFKIVKLYFAYKSIFLNEASACCA